MAWLDSTSSGPLPGKGKDGTVTFAGEMSAGAQARVVVFFPGVGIEAGKLDRCADADFLRKETATYWRTILDSAMKLTIPDEFLENLIRSSQVRCLIAARNEANGQRVAP
jgi:hypothetical protein